MNEMLIDFEGNMAYIIVPALLFVLENGIFYNYIQKLILVKNVS